MTSKSDSENLTTDACPSPPRDEFEKSKNFTQRNQDDYQDYEEQQDEEEEEEEINQYRQKQKHRKIPNSTFSKIRKNTPPTAIASVININNSNGIHIGSNYKININKTNKEQKKRNYIVTDVIKILFTNTNPVTRKDIMLISAHMNEEWRNTARALNYSDGQISQFYENYIKNGIKEVIYQFLLDWIQYEAEKATIAKLSNTLWETNQKEVVSIWSQNISK